MVWVALAALIVVYLLIWWLISRIPTAPRPVHPSTPPRSPHRHHMHMQQTDRLRMDLHTNGKDLEL